MNFHNEKLMGIKGTGSRGGHIRDVPKPHVRKYPKYGKRPIRISIIRFALGMHYYVSIEEGANPIWDISNPARPLWREAWDDIKGKGRSIDKQFKTVKGAEGFVKRTLSRKYPESRYRYDFETQAVKEFIYSKEGD